MVEWERGRESNGREWVVFGPEWARIDFSRLGV